jgi:hypothetical protein
MNATVVDGYIGLLDTLSANDKLDLIAKLSDSVKIDLMQKKSLFKKAFGAFQSSKTAEEIIDEIYSSRTLNRQIETF